MIRVSIVEDETLVRLGLRMCLESSPEIYVAGAFATAEEAMAAQEQSPVDILLTDIRLPGISGLELMQQLRKKYPQMLFVVLSCYDDFTYAQRAMEYGASRYLLKHELDEKKLPGMLIELMQENRQIISQESEQTADLPTCASRLCAEFGGARVLSFCFRGADEPSNATGNDLNRELVCGVIRTTLENRRLGHCFIDRNGDLFALTPSMEASQLAACFREISDNIQLYTDKNCFASASDCFSDATQLQQYLLQARERSQSAFFYETSCLLPFCAAEGTACPAFDFMYEDAFTPMWCSKTQSQIRVFFDACAKQQPAPDQIREVVMQYIQAMLRHAEFYYGLNRMRAYGSDMDPSYRTISRIDSMRALASWLWRVIDLAVRDIDAHQDLPYMIRAYLNEHYMQDLQQTDVAAVFHMSGPYFSQYFKQSFGVNYVQYLNTLRIEKAKLLLTTTRNSAESIGALVGIPNVNYFFRLFKKSTGRTVKEYRKRHALNKIV